MHPQDTRLCACGCGQQVKQPRSLFCRGHNRRMVGGKQAPPYARMNDPQYRAWRKEVLTRDKYHCQEKDCKRHNRTGRGLQAHHINSWHEFEDLRYDLSNGITLCTQHHRERERRYVGKEFEEPDLIPCGCGCGTMIPSENDYGQRRWYANGHQRRGKTFTAKSREKISHSLKGRPKAAAQAEKIAARNRSPEQRAAVSRGSKGRPNPHKGWRNTYLTQEEFIAAYPTTPSRQLAAICHVSEASITHWAQKLGLPPRYKTKKKS